MSRLPFLFIFTGIFGFVMFQAASLFQLFDWLDEGIRGQSGWFHVHLFVLGWATMLAMGAIYQLINVILQSTVFSEKLGYIHYTLFTIGLTGLLFGFIKAEIYWIAAFATLLLIGILVFAFNMTLTLIRAKKWDAITISSACAVLYLVLTGLSGMAMGLNFATGIWIDYHENLFGAHIWLGTIGWFGLLITGFSYKMLPMFYLSHDYSTKPQTAILLLWNAAVIVGALSFLLGSGFWMKWIALLLLAAAIVVYNIHMQQIKKHRHKRNPGTGIKWAVYVSQALAVTVIGMLIYTFFNPEQLLDTRTVIFAGWLYLSGWVSLTILGYASKIIPFLWWTHKYGKHAGKPGNPVLADLLNESKVNVWMAAMSVISLFVLVGLATGSDLVITAASAILAVLSLVYIFLISRVFTR